VATLLVRQLETVRRNPSSRRGVKPGVLQRLRRASGRQSAIQRRMRSVDTAPAGHNTSDALAGAPGGVAKCGDAAVVRGCFTRELEQPLDQAVARYGRRSTVGSADAGAADLPLPRTAISMVKLAYIKTTECIQHPGRDRDTC
jgi:hypothetical protein